MTTLGLDFCLEPSTHLIDEVQRDFIRIPVRLLR